ncbi:hypothetical protein [Cryobacterium sp. Hb1]|uniref:hypothetical protein n=1 Tax=Cryobacterium sp. Hb1 TaxID=1259147 RepID=UPI00106D114C|nr:hypothetical protein [Cryobacterium sp. Hb1]TFD72136.1 hypothetical protein E3T38_01175 [Cryobacterium sp. Hb1]
MHTTTKHTIVGAVVALLLTGGLAGCASETSANSLLPGLTSSTSDAAPEDSDHEITASPAATTEPIAGDLDGDGKLSAWETDQLGPSYITIDGLELFLARDQPLPDVVLAEVTDKLTQIPPFSGMGDGARFSDSIYAEIDIQEARTGKKIIPISYGAVDHDGTRGWVIGSPAPSSDGGFESAVAAVASATAWAAGKSNYYVIIVVG